MGSGGGGGGGGGGESRRPAPKPRPPVSRRPDMIDRQPASPKPKPTVSRPTGGEDRPDFGVVKRKVSTVAPKPAPRVPDVIAAPKAQPAAPKPTPKPTPKPAAPKPTPKPTPRVPDIISAPKAQPAAPKTGAKLGDTGGPASEKMREVGVRYTPTSTPDGGLKIKADIRKTAPSGELARERGPSPGDVLATVGDLPGVGRDTAAANIAGRPGLNKDVLGDLATRAREGQLPAGKITVPGAGSAALNLLNLAGKKSAMSILTKIAKDEPVIKDGRVTYSTEIVKDERGGIAGVVEPGPIEGTKVYSGRPEFNPLAAPEPEQEPEPIAAPIEPAVEDVTQDTLLAPTKKRARATRSKRFAEIGRASCRERV